MSQDPEDNGPAKTIFIPSTPTDPGPAVSGGEAAPVDDSRAEDAWFSGGGEAAEDANDTDADSDTAGTPAKGRRGRKAGAPADAETPAPPAASAPSTILQPSTAPPPVAAPSPPPSAVPFGGTGAPFAAPPGGVTGRVSIGSVLNHIYEVRRFIARGGMGEVYEGINVNTDERVAIKVILPHLAADPNVQAMFRKEARTLTRLSNPALVQYRVLANEPVLGVLYIVTDFLDGLGLDEMIGKIRPSQPELLALIRRLAEGLRVAHSLGAIHRDISPDNILLPNGRIDQATIIDFGIAKDLDASHATIVGDGFAGKLAFVAPEQFGDFGREIGPWTDVYSLGLVMLALAGGKNADMGSTLVEAVDKRRAGPDLSVLSPSLVPLFSKMLAPNPKDRYRSMDEVIEGVLAVDSPLSLRPATTPPPPAPKPVKEKVERPAPAPKVRREGGQSLPIPLIVGGLVGLVILGIGIPLALKMGKGDGGADAATTAGAADQGLQAISCSWIEPDGAPDSPRLKGAARSGFEGPVSQRVKGADISGVMFLDGQSCPLLETVRPLKAPTVPGAEWVKAVTTSFTPARQAECGDDPRQALAYVDVDTGTASGEDMALYLLRPGGTIQAVFRGKAQIRAGSGAIATASPAGANRTRISLCNDVQGPYGLLALRGAGPFTADSGAGAIADRLASDAKAKGWTSQMDWYRVEAASATAAAPTPAPAQAPTPKVVPAAAPAPKPVVRAAPKRETPRPVVAKPKPAPAAPRPAPAPRGSRCNEALGCD